MRPAAEGTGIKAGGSGSCSACAGRRSQCSHQIPWFFQSDQHGKGYLGRNGKIENVQTVAALRGKTVDEIYN